MVNLKDDLHAVEDDLEGDAQRLAEIEKTKGDLDPADPALRGLSATVEQLTGRMASKAVAESELVERIQADQPLD